MIVIVAIPLVFLGVWLATQPGRDALQACARGPIVLGPAVVLWVARVALEFGWNPFVWIVPSSALLHLAATAALLFVLPRAVPELSPVPFGRVLGGTAAFLVLGWGVAAGVAYVLATVNADGPILVGGVAAAMFLAGLPGAAFAGIRDPRRALRVGASRSGVKLFGPTLLAQLVVVGGLAAASLEREVGSDETFGYPGIKVSWSWRTKTTVRERVTVSGKMVRATIATPLDLTLGNGWLEVASELSASRPPRPLRWGVELVTVLASALFIVGHAKVGATPLPSRTA